MPAALPFSTPHPLRGRAATGTVVVVFGAAMTAATALPSGFYFVEVLRDHAWIAVVSAATVALLLCSVMLLARSENALGWLAILGGLLGTDAFVLLGGALEALTGRSPWPPEQLGLVLLGGVLSFGAHGMLHGTLHAFLARARLRLPWHRSHEALDDMLVRAGAWALLPCGCGLLVSSGVVRAVPALALSIVASRVVLLAAVLAIAFGSMRRLGRRRFLRRVREGRTPEFRIVPWRAVHGFPDSYTLERVEDDFAVLVAVDARLGSPYRRHCTDEPVALVPGPVAAQ